MYYVHLMFSVLFRSFTNPRFSRPIHYVLFQNMYHIHISPHYVPYSHPLPSPALAIHHQPPHCLYLNIVLPSYNMPESHFIRI